MLLLSHDKHVSFRSIYMGKLLKLIEKFLLADTHIHKKRDNFQIDAMRYTYFFSIEFHHGFIFVFMVLMFDVTQFPCFILICDPIFFRLKNLTKMTVFISQKILSIAQQYTVTPLTYHFLLLD